MTLIQYFTAKKENNFIWIRGIDDTQVYRRSPCYMWQHYNKEDMSYYVIDNEVYIVSIPFDRVKKMLNLVDNISSFLIYDLNENRLKYLHFWQDRRGLEKQEYISWLEECSRRVIKCVAIYTI